MSLWENLEQMHIDEVERLAGSRAILIAKHRVDKQLGPYLKTARSGPERASRVALVIDSLDDIVKEAADEHGTPTDVVREEIVAHINSYKLACASCGCEDGACGEGKNCGCKDCGSCGKESKTAGGHAPGCDCNFCANMGKGFGNKDEEESEDDDEVTARVAGEYYQDATCPECSSKDVANQSESDGYHQVLCNKCGERFHFDKNTETSKTTKWHIVADKKLPGWNDHQKSDRGAVFGEHGGTYDKETLDLGASKDAVGDQGAVKTDHKRVPEEGLKPVPIDSKEHPHDDQSVEERWNREYTGPYTDSGDANTSKKPHEFVDAGDPIGNTEAYPTSTFSGDAWSTNPVTNVALSKWHIP